MSAPALQLLQKQRSALGALLSDARPLAAALAAATATAGTHAPPVRGVVVAAGGAALLSQAWLSLRALRRTGSTLPCEVWHAGAQEVGLRRAKGGSGGGSGGVGGGVGVEAGWSGGAIVRAGWRHAFRQLGCRMRDARQEMRELRDSGGSGQGGSSDGTHGRDAAAAAAAAVRALRRKLLTALFAAHGFIVSLFTGLTP